MGDFYTIIYGYGVYAVCGKERLEVGEEEERERCEASPIQNRLVVWFWKTEEGLEEH